MWYTGMDLIIFFRLAFDELAGFLLALAGKLWLDLLISALFLLCGRRCDSIKGILRKKTDSFFVRYIFINESHKL